MRTKKIITLQLVIFLAGFVITGYSQGITNSGGYITNGTSSSFIEFGGGGNMTLSSTTADRTTLGNVKVDFTSNTYKLTIPSDSYITLAGNLTLSDSLILEASSSSMASLLMSSSSASVTGAYARVEQYLVQDQWHGVSAPVSGALSNVYYNVYLRKWSEPNNIFSDITITTEPLTVTKGFFAWSASSISSPTTVNFKGLLNTGNIAVTNLSYTAAPRGVGWNLIGNPYPSAVEWNSSWTKTSINPTIYIFVSSAGQYRNWNYNYTGSPNTLTNGEIPPTQGFWVKASASSPSPALTFPNSERVHTSNSFYKSGKSLEDMITISVSGNGYDDQISVGLLNETTNNFDSEYDAYKLYGIAAAPQLYSYNNDTKFAVNIFPEISDNKIIPVGLEVGADGFYEISLKNLIGFDDVPVYLEDLQAHKIVDIKQIVNYKFFASAGDDAQRFLLHFSHNEAPFVSEGTSDNNVVIYSSDKKIIIQSNEMILGDIRIYDILGQKVFSGRMEENSKEIDISGNSGYYIVKVVSDKIFTSKKVFVR